MTVLWGWAPPRMNPWTVVIEGIEQTASSFPVGGGFDEAFAIEPVSLGPGQGAAFRASDIGDLELWRMQGDRRGILCRDSIKRAVLAVGATNVEFLQVGTVSD